MGWTTTDLLTRIRREGRLSSNDPDYTDAVLLDTAYGVMLERFVATIIDVKQEYYDRYEDTSIVANQRAYAFSARAFSSSLREVVYIDSAGEYRPLTPLSYMQAHGYANTTSVEPSGYTTEDDKVIPLPTPNTAQGTLRLVYEYRPGDLVATSACMEIESITGGLLNGSAPWASEPTSDLKFDIIKGTSPFALVSADLDEVLIVNGTSITFAVADLDTTRVAVGDWVCLANESCIPQIPLELHLGLAQAVGAEILGVKGDPRGAAQLESRALGALARIRKIIVPRVRGKQKKWVNTSSPLRRSRGRMPVWDGGSA